MPEHRKKLIEVALPLEAINKESAREKSIRHGHPSTLHLWWARRPLAACRAVLFAQLVDDPSSLPDEFPTEEAQEVERQRLFHIIEEFVKWENTTNEAVLHKARVEVARSAARNYGVSLPRSMTSAEVDDALKRYAPPVLDSFAGGGSIPLEAQRLGLEVYACDLNPVAVLINKALIEIPPKFAGRPPVNPESRKKYLHKEWKGAQGLAEDVRYYGKWMRDEAWKRIGHLYPKLRLSKEYSGVEATVIAWIWARTVKCPNPACGAQMPLVRSFALSTKKGNEARIDPEINKSVHPPSINYIVRHDKASAYPSTVSRQGARCLVCGTAVTFDYVAEKGREGQLHQALIAVVADGKSGRAYLSPNQEQELIARDAKPVWAPYTSLPEQALGFRVQRYGMTHHADLFTARQLAALSTFSDLIQDVRKQIEADTLNAGAFSNQALANRADDASGYAIAVATYLAFAVDRSADYWSSFAMWAGDFIAHTFGRNALSMVWDFAEANPFSDATGNWLGAIEWISRVVSDAPSKPPGTAMQCDATAPINDQSIVISTDPPYYDNVPYADLSDFFYVWLRHSIGEAYPNVCGTMLVPKAEELVAEPFRHGGSEGARQFFEDGLGRAFMRMREAQDSKYPLTVYYAFKQSESDGEAHIDPNGIKDSASTGWETMLEGLLTANFSIVGTLPIRTERPGRLRETGSNALATSIVLVCRPRSEKASIITRRDFLSALKRELPKALRDLQRGNIAPVDLAQAAIGPGMAVYSRYSKVLESDGTAMRVRTALQLINQTLDEVLAEQEGEYDADTRWAVAWFEQYGLEEGPYGVAETLSKAKNTAVSALVEAGILRAQGGKVRLLSRNELSSNWNPDTAKRLTVWEVTQRLIQALQEHGDTGAAAILDHVGGYGEVARDLAYRLYTVCERKKWADEALAYNSLVVEWSDISGTVEQRRRTTAEQASLFS